MHQCLYFIACPPCESVSRAGSEWKGWMGVGWDASKTVWLNMEKSAAPPREADFAHPKQITNRDFAENVKLHAFRSFGWLARSCKIVAIALKPRARTHSNAPRGVSFVCTRVTAQGNPTSATRAPTMTYHVQSDSARHRRRWQNKAREAHAWQLSEVS